MSEIQMSCLFCTLPAFPTACSYLTGTVTFTWLFYLMQYTGFVVKGCGMIGGYITGQMDWLNFLSKMIGRLNRQTEFFNNLPKIDRTGQICHNVQW